VPIIYGQPPLGVSSVGGVLQNAPSSDYGSQSLLSQPSSAAPSGSSSINNNPPVNIKSYDELKAFESLQKAPLYKQVGILITNPITTISADIDLLRGNEKRFREKIGSEVLQANLISEESAKGNIIPALGKGASAALELLPISAGKGIGLGIRTIEKIPAIGKGITTIAKGGLISLAGYSIIEPITRGDTSEAIARGAYFGIALGTSGATIKSTQNVLADVSGRTFIESGKDVGAKVLSESKSISMIQAKPNVLTSTESRYVGEVLKVGERNNLIEVGLKGGVESASKQITMLKSGQGSRKYLQTETTDIQPVETIIRMSPAELSRGASISRTPESVEFSEFAQFGKKTGASIAKTSKGEFMGAEETSGSVIRGRGVTKEGNIINYRGRMTGFKVKGQLPEEGVKMAFTSRPSGMIRTPSEPAISQPINAPKEQAVQFAVEKTLFEGGIKSPETIPRSDISMKTSNLLTPIQRPQGQTQAHFSQVGTIIEKTQEPVQRIRKTPQLLVDTITRQTERNQVINIQDVMAVQDETQAFRQIPFQQQVQKQATRQQVRQQQTPRSGIVSMTEGGKGVRNIPREFPLNFNFGQSRELKPFKRNPFAQRQTYEEKLHPLATGKQITESIFKRPKGL